MSEKKIITVVIPAFKAKETIEDALSSIQIQSVRDVVSIVISNDNPDDNCGYEYLKDRFPNLDIKTIDCEKNGGPGVARQRGFDEVKTEWVTFMDADDVFISPFSIENLINNITPNCIEVQGPFFQEIIQGKLTAAERQQIMQAGRPIPPRMTPRNDVTHP